MNTGYCGAAAAAPGLKQPLCDLQDSLVFSNNNLWCCLATAVRFYNNK